MPTYRIKAFFTNGDEKAAAKRAESDSIISDTEWTDGYVIGVIDGVHIKQLRSAGLLVTPIEVLEMQSARTTRAAVAGDGGADRTIAAPEFFPDAGELPVTVAGRSSDEKIISDDRQKAEFYVVRLHGPLTEQRRQILDRQKISFLGCLGGCAYSVRLKPRDVKYLAEQTFVDTIRLYGAADTLRVRSGAGPAMSGAERATRGGTGASAFNVRYAVRAHRSEDLKKVVTWLKKRRRRPIVTHPDALRVTLVQAGKDVIDLAALPEVAEVEEMMPTRLLDRVACRILGLERPAAPELGLAGEGQRIGIADTGLDDSHPDFLPKERIVGIVALGRPGDHSDPDGHGTHVAGCAVGDGAHSKGEVRGAAPKAQLFFQSIMAADGTLGGLPRDLGQLFDQAYRAGVRIHNNSWGAFVFAQYGQMSRDVDRFVAEHPDMLIVIAAGNDAIAVPRARGGGMNSEEGFVDWPCVAAPATAKNGLTVGASRNCRDKGGYSTLTWGEVWDTRYPHAPIGHQRISDDADCLAAFSSRGPTEDNVIKPDIVAPGTDIAAARSRDAPLYRFWGAFPDNPKYAFMGGTSMAAPYVAGCAALVREYFQDRRRWAQPSAALLKATLINGARRMSGTDATAPAEGEPNFHQGFGRIDMTVTIPNPMSPDLKLAFVDTWLDPQGKLTETGKSFQYQIMVGGKLPLRVCLAWTDLPMAALQNKLLLTVSAGARKFLGNAGSARSMKISGQSKDRHNNVHVLRIDEPQSVPHVITVTADDLFGPQAIALVVSGDLGSGLHPIAGSPKPPD